jgi:hypothetical protein
MSNTQENIQEDRLMKLVDVLEDFFGSEVYLKKLNIKRLKTMKSLAEKEYNCNLSSSINEQDTSIEANISRGHTFFYNKLLDEQIEYEIESYKEMKTLNRALQELNFTYQSNHESFDTSETD